MPVETPIYSSDYEDEEYFEDDLMGGLNRSCSITDASHYDSEDFSDDGELSSDQLEMRALEQMAVRKQKHFSGDIRKRCTVSGDNDTNNNFDGRKVDDSFLFDEKASNDGIDKATLRKIKVCFDGQRIKDLYMLSGRLQDMITDEEINDILNNIEIYSEFIDDDVLEILTSTHGTVKKSHDHKPAKKIIGVEKNGIENFGSECHIRAVFEQHCNGQRRQTSDRKHDGTVSQCELTSNANNIRAFFEESLVRSASTLKIIHAKIDTDNHDSNFVPTLESPVTDGLSFDDATDEVNANDGRSLSPSSTLVRPSSLDPLTQPTKRKILVTPDILSKDDDQKSLSSISNHSETDMFSHGVDDLLTPDDIDTPDELDESILERFGSIASDTIPEMSAAEEYEEERSWRTCYISGIERKIDLKVIEPYKKVLSHGGYYGDDRNAIIVFSACYLPDRCRRDYDYVMDNLFLYVLTTLDTLVAEDYILIYLHGATQRSNMPSFGWLKRCYQMIDRRLRKNLKQLFLVHPSFWVKTIVIMTKPFISSKFSRKLRFITNLQELAEIVPMDDVCIPDKVKQFDETKVMEENN
ncbi:ARF4 (predicted) [Pycnogonum litorale]